MRIISGIWRSRPIRVPKGLPIRPTTDVAKEALFSILENGLNWEKTKSLDLFAGSGNISYELVSRGCKNVLAVDRESACCRFMKSTSQELKMEGLVIKQSDVFKFLTGCRDKFDFIFADPPYDLPNIVSLVNLIFQKELLNYSGLFVLEHPSLISYKNQPEFEETRKYGTSSFSFFRNHLLNESLVNTSEIHS